MNQIRNKSVHLRNNSSHHGNMAVESPRKKKKKAIKNQIKTMEEIEAKTFLRHDCKSVSIEKITAFEIV